MVTLTDIANQYYCPKGFCIRYTKTCSAGPASTTVECFNPSTSRHQPVHVSNVLLGVKAPKYEILASHCPGDEPPCSIKKPSYYLS